MSGGRRIFGAETEYGLYMGRDSDPTFRNLDKLTAQGCLSVNGRFDIPAFFFYNGGHFNEEQAYVEGNQSDDFCPEYATPECRSAKDLVTWEKAGDVIMSLLFNLEPENQMVIYKHCGGIIFDNTNSIENGSTVSGHHESYQLNLSREMTESLIFNMDSPISQRLMAFLVSRIIINGAGCLRPTGGYLYYLSPRSRYIDDTIADRTTSRRPIIVKSRHGDHIVLPEYSRLHLILGDHNMCEMAIFLTVGTTHLVLRMIEEDKNHLEDCPWFRRPEKTLKFFNETVFQNLREGLEGRLPCGSSFASALEMQKYFYRKAKRFLNRRGGTEEEFLILDHWKRVLLGMNTNWRNLFGEIDWITKLCLIERYLKSIGASIDISVRGIRFNFPEGLDADSHMRVCAALDLQYHRIGNRGIFHKLVKAGKIKRITTDEEIEHAVFYPPGDTRAKIRGEFLRFLKTSHMYGEWDAGNWSYGILKLPSESAREVKELRLILADPFDTVFSDWDNIKQEVEEVIRELNA